MLKDKKLVITIIVVAVIVLGGIGWFVTQDKSDSTSTQNSSSQNSNNSSGVTKGSLSSLSTGKKAQECTMNYSGANGSGTGTMYADGNGRGRMHLELKTEKGNIGQSDQIMRDNKAYSWTTTEGQTFGMVMDMSKMNSQQSQAQSQSNTSTPAPDQSFDINCKDWKIDESKFTIPANVNFMDLNNLQNSVPTSR